MVNKYLYGYSTVPYTKYTKVITRLYTGTRYPVAVYTVATVPCIPCYRTVQLCYAFECLVGLRIAPVEEEHELAEETEDF